MTHDHMAEAPSVRKRGRSNSQTRMFCPWSSISGEGTLSRFLQLHNTPASCFSALGLVYQLLLNLSSFSENINIQEYKVKDPAAQVNQLTWGAKAQDQSSQARCSRCLSGFLLPGGNNSHANCRASSGWVGLTFISSCGYLEQSELQEFCHPLASHYWLNNN